MKRLILALVAAAALVAPASALAGNVVLKVERGSRLAAVANQRHVMLVHTAAALKLRVGDRISMRSRRLANGTFAARDVHVLGRARHVAFGGFVMSRSRHDHSVTISAAGAPVTVQTANPPAPGSEVNVDATVNENGDLDADDVNVVTAAAPGGSIEGHVSALGTGSITIASEHEVLVLTVPAGFSLGALQVGDEVLAQFSQQSDGSLVLTSLTADENAVAANNNQGEDNNGEDNGGTQQNGGGHDGGGDGGGGGHDGGGGGGGDGGGD
jgi:uncharacterized membrane protein YgcG